jgi:DNA segregation ATPase FtsK/SpoIIIE-like protein
MSEQLETLRLADALWNGRNTSKNVVAAVAELRRLAEVEQAYNLLLEKTYAQPAQRQPLTDDPLQGAVDWLLQADGEYFCTAIVQRTLRIGYNRAKRLYDTAKERAEAAHGITGEKA